MNEFGHAYRHPETWEFIAHQLLLHGSFMIDLEYQDRTLSVLFSLPHMPFTSQAYLYLVVVEQGLVLRSQIQEPYQEQCFARDAPQELVLELQKNLQQVVLHLQ